jgi:hypothetical protein
VAARRKPLWPRLRSAPVSRITPALRRAQFPELFTTSPQGPPVSFVDGSDSEAIVEVGGRRYPHQHPLESDHRSDTGGDNKADAVRRRQSRVCPRRVK